MRGSYKQLSSAVLRRRRRRRRPRRRRRRRRHDPFSATSEPIFVKLSQILCKVPTAVRAEIWLCSSKRLCFMIKIR